MQGTCPIPQGGAACWARVAREEKIPAPVAALPVPAKVRAEAYRAGKAPMDTPSIVSFPVRLVGTGSLAVEADGPKMPADAVTAHPPFTPAPATRAAHRGETAA